MEIQVRNEVGDLIWSRNSVGGLTSQAYGVDGTLQQIEQALALALAQCRGELAIAVDGYRMGDASGSSAQVNGDVPVSGVRHSDASG